MEKIETNDSEPQILLIEPFYGGSHKELIDFLSSTFSPKFVGTLSAKKWHWRARSGALILSQSIPEVDFTHLFCSSVLNLAELLGLRQDLRSLKKILYFHENQLVYPVRNYKEHRDFQYGYNQILSALCADVVLFNSRYNMNTFLDNIDSFLARQPDYKIKNLKFKLVEKCSVLYFPVKFPRLAFGELSEPSSILRILWPHRWEHDKNPESFFHALFKLKEDGYDFRVSVLGETYGEVPNIFLEAKKRLQENILHWGYVKDKNEYYKILATESDVVVSTSNHEFYGVAMIEAAYLGCYPLVPNRLVYPEIFPKAFIYSTDQQLYKRLREFAKKPHLSQYKPDLDMNKYSTDNLEAYYRNIFSS